MELGFVEPCEPELLTAPNFPTKFGGRPVRQPFAFVCVFLCVCFCVCVCVCVIAAITAFMERDLDTRCVIIVTSMVDVPQAVDAF